MRGLQLLSSLLILASSAIQATSTHFFLRRTQEDNNSHTIVVASGPGIVGGLEAEAGEFPWFAAFVPLVQCGGTLIAHNRVLTAAHCVVNGAPGSVRIGPTDMSNGEEIQVTCGMYHSDYYVGPGGDLFNDVAVLKLAGSSSKATIALNSDQNWPNTEGEPLRVVGYGATSQGGPVSPVLKKMDTAFYSTSTCQLNYPNVEAGTHVCGNVDNEGDCQGDSGGPLFSTKDEYQKRQVGIVSYGIGCAQPSEDVYAGVAKYYDWIQQQIDSDECNVETGTPCLWTLLFGCLEAMALILRNLF